MIVYNITFHLEKEIIQDCLIYLKKEFIPRAAGSGFLLSPCLRRVMHTTDDEGESYSVQFHVKNTDTLQYWLESEGNSLHQQLVQRFGSRIAGFTTLLEEIDWEDE